MGSADWTYMDDGLDVGAVARGVTAGFASPPGGGRFVFGFHSIATTPGAVGLFVNAVDFAPMSRGGSVRGCVQRAPSGGATGFSPFLFVCAQGPSVGDAAYLLGLSEDDPNRIVLRKGSLTAGAMASEGPGVLLRSNESFRDGAWIHLRLDAIANDSGDVVVNVYTNDLTRHPLGDASQWTAISGMPSFIDDALGIRTGSRPLAAGRAGFGFASRDVTRRAFFDQLEVLRQG